MSASGGGDPLGEIDFHHPFQPYAIQTTFMRELYACIDAGQVGIFESPTGTGKSLSLACGSLTWLRHNVPGNIDEKVSDGDEPLWVTEHSRASKRSALVRQVRDHELKLAQSRAKERQQKQRYENGEPFRKRPKSSQVNAKKTLEPSDSDFLVDYEADKEPSSFDGPENDTAVSATTLRLMTQLGMAGQQSEDEEPLAQPLRIFFASRTHSQLAQFAGELRRLRVPPNALLVDESSDPEWRQHQPIKHLALASRKNLCINPDVAKLSTVSAINERCLDMQQGKSSRCQYLPNQETAPLVHDFRDRAVARIRDIEDLAAIGKEMSVCPYYASRAAVQPAEIIALPYPLLLQKSARDALDISLRGHVVIIDEAHNLSDTIAGIYSLTMTLSQLTLAREQLTLYLLKFRNRLKGVNRIYLAQLVRIVDSLTVFLKSKVIPGRLADGQTSSSELMSGPGADQVDLFKLCQYLQESKLARKVHGYVEYSRTASEGHKPTQPVLQQLQGFLQVLMHPSEEGRFFFEVGGETDGRGLVRYLLLDATFHFKTIVDDARSVILAGGTMSPMDDYVKHLLGYLPPERLRTLSCDHVIPGDHVATLVIGQGIQRHDLEFTFERRNSAAMIRELGMTLTEICSIVPDGVVVFFPSYAYMQQVAEVWRQTSTEGAASVWSTLSKRKAIYIESQAQGNADDVLARYTEEVMSRPEPGPGALLMAVVGGKMSEGINFSDRLGRCVAVVGLPFPNMHTAEWRARMAFIEQRALSHGESPSEAHASARTFYENACMRAVNQSIGRAIRHANDYAAIILLDRRYGTSRIQSKLPKWIGKSLDPAAQTDWASQAARLRSFYTRVGRSKG